MDDLIFNWLRAHPHYALSVVPGIAFLEACVGIGLFISGVILLSVCTLMYREDIASLQAMLPLAFLGAAASDHCGYYLGRWLGPGFHETRLAKRRRNLLEKAEGMFRRYGELAILFGRLMTAVRSMVPLLVGVSGVRPLRYTLYDLLACAVWTTGLGLLVVGIDNLF